MTSKPSIKDVARIAGVSIGTVDRVLHDRGQVSEPTKIKVQQVIKDLEYKPNLIARSLAYKKNIKIGILLPRSESRNEYWYYPKLGIEKAIRESEFSGTEIFEAYYDLHSRDSFRENLQQLLKELPDGVITAPMYNDELLSAVSLFDEKGTKYAFLDSDLSNTKRNFFIGQDPVQSGRVVAQLMDFTLKGGPNEILILHIDPITRGIPTVNLREKGFRDFFKEKDQVKIHTFHYSQEHGTLNSALEDIFNQLTNLGGVFVPDSKSHILARQLLQFQRPHLFLIGFDALKKNIRFLKEGIIDILISQKPITQGFEAFNELLQSILFQSESQTDRHLPIDIITRENVKYYFEGWE